jgi:hypothetical protein
VSDLVAELDPELDAALKEHLRVSAALQEAIEPPLDTSDRAHPDRRLTARGRAFTLSPDAPERARSARAASDAVTI